MTFFTDVDYKRMNELASEKLKISKECKSDLSNLLATIKEKILINDDTLLSIISAINAGFNIILYGPPGTAKSTLSEILPKVIWNAKCNIHTADSDWSVKKVIGGLNISYEINGDDCKEIIEPKDGYLVSDIYECYSSLIGTKDHDTVFSIIDEFNRTNMDECLGPLFTAMGSDNKSLKLDYNIGYKGKPLHITIPASYRIICNMNKYDRTFTNDLSEALTRRFKWIYIGSPSQSDYDREKKLIKDRVFNNVLPSSLKSADILIPLPDYKNTPFFDTYVAEPILNIITEIRKELDIGTSYGIDAIKIAYHFYNLKFQLLDFYKINGFSVQSLENSNKIDDFITTLTNTSQIESFREKIDILLRSTIDSSITMTIAPLFDAIEDSSKLEIIKELLKDYPLCLAEISRINLLC